MLACVGAVAAASPLATRYIDLIENAVTGSLHDEAGRCIMGGDRYTCSATTGEDGKPVFAAYNSTLRLLGRDWYASCVSLCDGGVHSMEYPPRTRSRKRILSGVKCDDITKVCHVLKNARSLSTLFVRPQHRRQAAPTPRRGTCRR